MRRLLWPLWLAASISSPICAFAQPSNPIVQAPPAELPYPSSSHPASTDARPLGPESGQLTLERALALAGERSYAISAAQLEVDATDGAVRQAGTRPNPELSAGIEDTRPATRVTSATLSIPFELGGKRAARVEFAERGRNAARAELVSTRSDLRATVIAAFFRVLVAQERTVVAQNAAELARRGADAAGRRVTAGKISPVDETRFRVEQANAQLEVKESQTELTVSRMALSSLWGSPSPEFTAVTGGLDVPPSRPSGQALLLDLESSPIVVASRLQVERLEAGVGVERSKRVPDVTLSVGSRRDNQLGFTQAVVGVSVPLPIFNRNEGAIYEASRRALKAQEDLQAARVRVATGLQQSATELAGARATAQTLQDTVLPAAQSAFDASSRGFEAGKFGLLDVLDSQRALLQARVRYLDALGTAYRAATDIDRLLGR